MPESEVKLPFLQKTSVERGKLCSSENPLSICCRAKMPEIEGKLMFLQKPQFERGKTVFQWKTLYRVKMPESEGKLQFLQKPQFERGKNYAPVKNPLSICCRVKMLESEGKLPFLQKPQFKGGKTVFQWKTLCWFVVEWRCLRVRENCCLCRNLNLREGKLWKTFLD